MTPHDNEIAADTNSFRLDDLDIKHIHDTSGGEESNDSNGVVWMKFHLFSVRDDPDAPDEPLPISIILQPDEALYLANQLIAATGAALWCDGNDASPLENPSE